MQVTSFIGTVVAMAALANPIVAQPLDQNATHPLHSLQETTNLPGQFGMCLYADGGVHKHWFLRLPNDQKYNEECGRGVLDNVRGGCGDVTKWECVIEPSGASRMTFKTMKTCAAKRVEGAVKKATYGEHFIHCEKFAQ